jgi:tetratricopeptide (TPR) repeat protein
VDWSYQLLSEPERQLLNRLSVFPGGWTLEAAERVCGGDPIGDGETLEVLSKLVSKSLVAVESDTGGDRRYRLLESVRHFARERLVQAGAIAHLRERHFQFFCDEFRGMTPILRLHGQLRGLKRVQSEQENLRAALEWALTSPPYAEQGLELAGALFWFWTKRGLFEEGRSWLERAVAVRPGASGPIRARALIGLAHMHYFQGRYPETEACAVEALAIGRAAGDAWAESFALFLQAITAFEQGRFAEAGARARDALDAAAISGELVQQGGPRLVLANIAVLEGDHDRAQQLYEESIDVHRRAGDAWGLGILLSAAAGLRIIRHDFAAAQIQAAEALALCQQLEDPRGIAWSLEVFAGLRAVAGRTDETARLWGASARLLETFGGVLVPPVSWIRERYLDDVRRSIGSDRFQAATAEGRSMTPVQAIALAREEMAPG